MDNNKILLEVYIPSIEKEYDIFVPVNKKIGTIKKMIETGITDLTDEYVQQVWGEAVWLYKNTKNPFILSENAQKLLEENRKQFRYTSGLEDELNATLENKFKDKKFITNQELAFSLFADRDALSRNSKEARDIRYYMGHLGYEVGTRKKVDGKVVAGFAKLQ